MEQILAILIITICLWFILVTEKTKPPQNTLVPTDRPNKFISDGDAIDCGKVLLDKFILSFEAKINANDIILFNLISNETNVLRLVGHKLFFNGQTALLDFSPYLSVMWVQFHIYAEKTWTISVNSKPYGFGPVTATTANLIIGNTTRSKGIFAGAMANIKINGNYIYRLVNGGVNQATKKSLSVAGFNDLGLFGTSQVYEALKTIDNSKSSQVQKTFPAFKIAPFILFTLTAELRVFKAGIYLHLKDKKANKEFIIGKGLASASNILNIDLTINFLDVISIYINDTSVFCKNITTGELASYSITNPNLKEFDLLLQDTQICILMSLSQGERKIWTAGENILEYEPTDKTLNRLDLSDSIVDIVHKPVSSVWVCNFHVQITPTTGVNIFRVSTAETTLVIGFGPNVTISLTQGSSKNIWKINEPIEELVSYKVLIKYNGNLSITIAKPLAKPLASSTNETRRFLKFIPSLYNLFSQTHSVSIGSLSEHLQFQPGSIYYSHFSLNGIAFKHLQGITMRKKLVNLLSSLITIEFYLKKDTTLFTITLNKTIGIKTIDDNLYITLNAAKFFVTKLKLNSTYRLSLKFANQFILYVKEGENTITTYKFNPLIIPSEVAQITFPTTDVNIFSVFGRPCSL